MFVKTPFEEIEDALKEEIIHSAVTSLKSSLFHEGEWYADYVRLRCKAVKSKEV